MKSIILVALLSLVAYSQSVIEVTDSTARLCWACDAPEDSTNYIVYKRKCGDTTEFVRVLSTVYKAVTITRPEYGCYEYAVRSNVNNKYSDIHKSTDSNACIDGSTNCDTCTSNGPWLISWIVKPKDYTPQNLKCVR